MTLHEKAIELAKQFEKEKKTFVAFYDVDSDLKGLERMSGIKCNVDSFCAMHLIYTLMNDFDINLAHIALNKDLFDKGTFSAPSNPIDDN